MGVLFELVCTVAGLALKPVLLAKLYLQIGARSLCIVVLSWLEILRFAVSLHFVILWRLAIWTMALLSLPVRALTALYRERMLETQLHQLKIEMEILLLDTKELEELLHEAVKERETLETLLIELDKEHDEAIVKIKLLEQEVQDLKNQVQRLKEVHGKALWSYLDQDNVGKPAFNNSDFNKKQVMTDLYHDEKLYITRVISKGGTLARQRQVALSQSLFSVILSLVVGIIAWEAKDPCIPLVIALFVVVTMSLLSVLRLFTKIEHKPASESLVLLSINWFMLGTLAYPLLPKIARSLAPLAMSFLQRALE